MTFQAPSAALLLLLAPGACASTQKDTMPVPEAEPQAAAPLDEDERTEGAPEPEFDDDGTYDMVERYPEPDPNIPSTALAVTATTEDAIMIDPTLAAACDLPAPKVYFATDSAQLRSSADESLARLTACLQEHPLEDEQLMLVGHADPRGSDDYNRALGLDRANAVADALADRGLDRDRMTTYSRGEADAHEASAAWQRDRRVRIRLER